MSDLPPRIGPAEFSRLLKKSLAIVTIERKESRDGRRRINLAPNGVIANQACVEARRKSFFSSLLAPSRRR